MTTISQSCFGCGGAVTGAPAFIAEITNQEYGEMVGVRGGDGGVYAEAWFCSEKCVGDRRIVHRVDEREAMHIGH